MTGSAVVPKVVLEVDDVVRLLARMSAEPELVDRYRDTDLLACCHAVVCGRALILAGVDVAESGEVAQLVGEVGWVPDAQAPSGAVRWRCRGCAGGCRCVEIQAAAARVAW